MTIPIIPGPFQFLAEAGAAIGDISAAKEEHRRYAAGQAQKALEHVDNLVQLGILPAEILSSKEVQHLSTVAGYAPVQQGQVLPQPKEQLQRLTAEEIGRIKPGTTAAALATGTPTEGQVAVEDQKALARKGETAAQARVAEKVPSAGAAPAIEESQTAGAEAETAGARVNKEVYDSSLALLGSDPFAKRLADEAALGILSLRIQRLIANRQFYTDERQRLADRTRLLLESLNNMNQEYRDRLKAYEDQRRNDAALSGIDTNDAEAMRKFNQAYDEANADKLPNRDSIQGSYLDALGLTREEFQKQIKEGFGLMQGDTGTPAPGGKGKGGAAGGVSGGSSSSAPTSGEPVDVRGRQYTHIIQVLTTVDPVQAGDMLQDAQDPTAPGYLTDTEVKVLLQRLRSMMTADNYKALEDEYYAAKARKVAGPAKRVPLE